MSVINIVYFKRLLLGYYFWTLLINSTITINKKMMVSGEIRTHDLPIMRRPRYHCATEAFTQVTL